MNKISVFFIFIAMCIVSCKNSQKDFDKTKIAKDYYALLDSSDYSDRVAWFPDTLTTKEGDYIETYSQSDYLEFLKWDAVFDPSYDILDIKEHDGAVKAKISKMDKRIRFLHEAPMITIQTIKFQNDKIVSITTEYENFNARIWEENKNGFLNWIAEHHPELNAFIHDQTETGGQKYLEAITLYKNRD